MSLAADKYYQTLSCILLPLSGSELLLPKSIVKEIVYKPTIQTIDEGDKSDWLIGEIEWEDFIVPVISFDQLCNQPRVSKTSQFRAVICYAIEKVDQFPYYAIEVQSIPRPLILDSRALINHEGMMSKHSEVISSHVKIGSKELAIPNFEKLESILATRAS